MLARNAESLYWIGRYVERADDTARILDVSVHQLLEDATVDTDRAARTLLGVLGCDAVPDSPLDAWSVTELVGYSETEPGSIVSSVSRARENARGARHVERPARAPAVRPLGGSARVLLLRRGPRGDVLGHGGLDDEPRRHLAVLPARTLRRTGRHDRAAAHVAGVGPDVVAGLADRAPLRRRPGHLPAHLPRRARRGAGRPVPADGPPVPALGVPRAAAGRDVPDRAGQPADGADRSEGRGAAAARAGPQRAGVPASGRAARRPACPAQGPAGDHPRRRRGRVAAVLPRRPVGRVDRSGVSELASEQVSPEMGERPTECKRGSSELTWAGASESCTRRATATTPRCTSRTTRSD